MTATADLIRRFFADLSAGILSEDITTPGMTAWTLSGGDADKARFAGGVKLLQQLFRDGLRYDVQAVIVDGDRAAAEVRSQGVFTDGDAFTSDYAFLFRLDGDRIAAVREYANVEIVRQQIGPRIQALMASGAGAATQR